jgi:hypothetical protein
VAKPFEDRDTFNERRYQTPICYGTDRQRALEPLLGAVG